MHSSFLLYSLHDLIEEVVKTVQIVGLRNKVDSKFFIKQSERKMQPAIHPFGSNEIYEKSQPQQMTILQSI